MTFDQFSCQELLDLISTGAQLIDVRTKREFNQGALHGAKNIPIEGIQYQVSNIDKTRPVILYCKTGMRSGMVKKFFDSLGFTQVHNIGGYNRYAACFQNNQ